MGLLDFFRKTSKPFDLDSVLANVDANKIVIDVDDQLNKMSNHGEDVELLNDLQKVALFIGNLEREVNNGGFSQFYWNSSGEFAQETVVSLQEIGAVTTANIVQKANNEFPHGEVARSKEARIAIINGIEEKAETVWEQCDEEFYKYTDDLADLLAKFIRENRQAFE